MPRNLGNLAVAGIAECVCLLGARSPVCERTHPHPGVAVMLRGSFHVRASEGSALATSGALLLKNAGSVHAYTHVDDGGDRSLTFALDALDRPFASLVIPPSSRTAAAVAFAAHALACGDPELLQDAAHAITALALALDGAAAHAAPPAHAARIARALRYIDADPAGDCSLAMLAAVAGLTAFHFSRSFRAHVGQTPRQYVIAARLRAAALALASTTKPVTEVALDAGFVDLSNFMTTFRRAFGISPRRYRVSSASR